MRQLSFFNRPMGCEVAPAWQPALLRWLLLSHYVLFGLLLGIQVALPLILGTIALAMSQLLRDT